MNIQRIDNNINSNINILNNKNSVQNINNEKVDFFSFLNDAIHSVSNLEFKQEELEKKFALGELDNLHELTVATQEAEIGIQALMQVRNKVMDAYNEIMRIQV
ncbi:MAG: flagellar hook-basal body complex protein FliE [Peptostreptococcaceae bacterium]|nr:flagellar hook-basal body complex protein FliE [Peptostreptococcaceae bacterium]